MKERDLNPLEYVDNPAELEVQKELQRCGIENEPRLDACPHCNSELKEASGFAGELIVYCDCEKGYQWEDFEGAIRNVF